MTPNPSPGTAPAARLLSLDVLRGLTIALMVVVNAPGSWSSVYAPLLHASWHGLTPTDLVFPSFLCVVGFSIVLAYGKHRGLPAAPGVRRKILVRAGKLFALGLFLNLWPEFAFDSFRFAGVLQRIALVFAAAAMLFLVLRTRGLLVLTVGILVGYWALLSWVPVPRDAVIEGALQSGEVERAHGQRVPVQIAVRDAASIRPNLEPGTNLAAWLDRGWLPGRMYERTWDPEGWLSTVPSLATCLLGVLMGLAVRAQVSAAARARLLLAAAAVLLLVGYLWAGVFPLNKNLWTSSFVLVAGGWTLLSFAIVVWIVDLLQWTRAAYPFLVFGTNPIAAYVLAGMLWAGTHRSLFGQRALVEIFMDALSAAGVTAKLASLLAALCYAAVVFVPVAVLYRRKVFLRL